MTSTSKDGQLIDFVIRKLGGFTARGSSTRGGIGALKGLVRLVKSGKNISMAVDGPKGPIYTVKPGAFEISRISQSHIIPVGASCSHPLVFNRSWNKTYLPKPFSKVVVCFGKPIAIVEKGHDPKSSDLAQKLATQIFAARQQASKLIADNGAQC